MTSRDVIHSFYVPDFRVKQDVVPGRYTTVWFAGRTSPARIRSSAPSIAAPATRLMRGEVVALGARRLRALAGGRPARRAGRPRRRPAGQRRSLHAARAAVAGARGERAAAEHGCLRCHTLDGTPHIGPTWAGLYGSLVPLDGGATVIADEAYLTESMMDPLAKIHRGFPPVMPTLPGAARAARDGGDRRAHQVAARAARPRRRLPGPRRRRPPGRCRWRRSRHRRWSHDHASGRRRHGSARPLSGRGARAPVGAPAPDYLRDGRGVRSWLLTTDHKRIALMFYVVVLLDAVRWAASSRCALRIELLTPEPHDHGRR